MPSLIYQIDQVSSGRRVEFNSISSGGGSGSTSSGSASSASSASSSSSASGAAAATPTVFTPMPFTFVFKGSYYGLYHLIEQINGFAQRTAAGGVHVSGRLLTIQSADVTLEQKGGGSSGTQGGELTRDAHRHRLRAALQLRSDRRRHARRTLGSSQTTSASASPSSPTSPAVVRVTP